MKQRFTALDISAIVPDLHSRIVGLRIQNIYDINSRTYLLKFSKTDQKELLLIESGIRIHCTEYTREKNTRPSNFCQKLRKHLRDRRCTDIRQVGTDRIVDLEFAGATVQHTFHIIVEFYASGNVILTDGEYTILALLRVVDAGEGVHMAVKEKYNVESVQKLADSMDESALETALASSDGEETLKKAVLRIMSQYSPMLVEHAILEAGLPANDKLSTINLKEASGRLRAALDTVNQLLQQCKTTPQPGYILHEKQSPKAGEEHMVMYDEFHPFLLHQHRNREYQQFDSFNAAVDEFFSKIEAQKAHVKTRQQEEAGVKKLETIKKDQFSRMRGLESAQHLNVQKARLIEENIAMVDEAIQMVKAEVDAGKDWTVLMQEITDKGKQGDAVAAMIVGLKLEKRKFTILLEDVQEENGAPVVQEEPVERKKGKKGNADAKKPKERGTRIDISIDLTAYANAREYFTVKKQSAAKQEKTVNIAEKAFKSAEKKIKQDMKQIAQNKRVMNIQRARKRYWFEKFLWFISSENYLVIAGRDMQQNELLVKRHLGKNDLYVHADLHGAATVVIKNTPEGGEVPPTTLYQAGVMSVCWSKAWDAKMSTSAYWVYAHQVSKTAPTGEYLTTGSFMIRGKKNFLPPVQLVYGFSVMFRLDPSCIAQHAEDRKPNREWAASLEHEEETVPLEVEEEDAADAGLKTDWDKYHLDEHGEEAQAEQQDGASNVIAQLIASTAAKPAEQEPPKKPQKKKGGKKNGAVEKQEAKPVVDKKKQGPARRSKAKKNKKDKDHWSSEEEEAVAEPESVQAQEEQPAPEAPTVDEEPEDAPESDKETQQEQQEQPQDEESDSESSVAAEETDNLNLLDTLTGQPLADDTLLFAVPVCAPYSALQKFKYRAKLVPGSLKKGKACKTVLDAFLKHPEITQNEKELIKGMTEEETISVFLGKTKVSIPSVEGHSFNKRKK